MKDRRKLIQDIEEFKPYNEQEEKDKEMILHFLSQGDHVFFRENTAAHMSSSAWVVNASFDKVLMAYHNIYDSWAWTGGHADGETDLLSVAVREAKEETGIETVEPVCEDIFSLEVLTVNGHEKKGVYVPSHLHLNVTYLLQADEKETLRVKEDENSGVSWFPFSQCLKVGKEPWMNGRIYSKLLHKTRSKASLYRTVSEK